MKNCDSPRNEIPTPASSGPTWISSSNRTAGRMSRYGRRRLPSHRVLARPRGRATVRGTVWFSTTLMASPGSVAGVRGGRAPPPRTRGGHGSWSAGSAARGLHLLVGRRERGLHLGLAHGAARRGLRDELLDRIADERLHLPLLVDERHRLGVLGEDAVECLQGRRVEGLVLLRRLSHGQAAELTVEAHLLLLAGEELHEGQRGVLVLAVAEHRDVDARDVRHDRAA